MDLGSWVHFARAGPDMSPEVESLINKATKQARHQRRRGFQLPEHDVGALTSLQLSLNASVMLAWRMALAGPSSGSMSEELTWRTAHMDAAAYLAV